MNIHCILPVFAADQITSYNFCSSFSQTGHYSKRRHDITTQTGQTGTQELSYFTATLQQQRAAGNRLLCPHLTISLINHIAFFIIF